jgi:hypothetical protein
LAFGIVLMAHTACHPGIFNQLRFSAGQDWLLPSMAPEVGQTKAAVLDSLGPPINSLPQPDHDVFVYRVRADGTTAFNGAGGNVPFYYSTTRSAEQTLLVFFDRQGIVVRTAFSEAH